MINSHVNSIQPRSAYACVRLRASAAARRPID